VYGEEKDQLDEEHSDSQVGATDASTGALRVASGAKVRVWVYYNPTSQEITVFDTEPPESFGRREYDVGPIGLDEDLIKSYLATKEIWHKARDAFVAAVKAATGNDGPKRDLGF
jgi:hypothetical protein